MLRDFRRVAIVNRGEAAMRFIHAACEFRQETGVPLSTIAFFTEPDRKAMFVREADEAVCLGPAYSKDARTQQLRSAYVDYECLQSALEDSSADAVWVGWGFVAEHARFADLCEQLGLVFIGPSGRVMRLLGDKITSKLLATEAGIPVAPWSGPIETLADARDQARRLGYPLMVKATAGGGGHGIRRVDSAAQLDRSFESARAEAFKAFGDPTVFMEHLVIGARHVEVQIVADHHGKAWPIGVRDCTIQRRHQKILEEAPSPALSHEQDEFLRDAAVRLAKAAGYHNTGTVEFLYEPKEKQFSFMEMNTRLQVEHPVTECTTGIDIVKLQIHVARGGHLEGEPPRTSGHAIEVRLNAEDPDNAFSPAPGLVERFRVPTGPGIRTDTGIAENDSIPAEFDSMIAKIIAHGQNRQEALSRLSRALHDTTVVIKGGTTNKSFLMELVKRPEVQTAEVDTGWMDRVAAAGEHVSRQHAGVALVQAALEAHRAEQVIEEANFFASAMRGRPAVRDDAARLIELKYRGNSYSLRIERLDTEVYRVTEGRWGIIAQIERLRDFEYWLTAGSTRYHIVSVAEGFTYRIDVNGVSHRVDREDGGIVRCPAPAVVVSVLVNPDDRVTPGQTLLVLEAMKMEMQISAPFGGRVRQVLTIPYVQVCAGAPLIQIEADEAQVGAIDSNRTSLEDLSEPCATSGFRPASDLAEMRQMLLGFDIDPARCATLIASLRESAESTSKADDTYTQEHEILGVFVDICSLFERKPNVNGSVTGESPTAEAYLFTYLRTLEREGEGMPANFVNNLRRALSHYGVATLENTAELRSSLLSIYKSHARMDRQIGIVLAILEHRLKTRDNANDAFRMLLDRMVDIAEFPAVSELAREVRYLYFDQPIFERARTQAYAEVEEHLSCLEQTLPDELREQHIRALIECPQPLHTLFSARFATASLGLRQAMLEALTARYYRIRELHGLKSFVTEGSCLATAEYEHEGTRIQLVATGSTYEQLKDSIRVAQHFVSRADPNREIVLDFFLSHMAPLPPADYLLPKVLGILNSANFRRPIRRVVVGVAANALEHGNIMQCFTFRMKEDHFEEEKLFRGMHPMMAKRLHLWRFRNFHISRLPSVEDVYLFHAIANENPKDERLFACAEVRDLTPVTDEHGAVIELPHLQRMFSEAAAAMRVVQSRRSNRNRLHWNRILLYVWPPVYLSRDDMEHIAQKLVPLTEGLGLEQVVVRARIADVATGQLRDTVLRISAPGGPGLIMTFRAARNLQPLKPLSEYTQKLVRLRQRGFLCPYEIIQMITPSVKDTHSEFPPGDFEEYDLDPDQRFVPVNRPSGHNRANIIAGVIRNYTKKYPEGMTRVILLGDPSKDLGSLAEPECRRILAAIDLAESMRVPIEWFPISAGARISMESGVENMDWIARVLRRIVEFTQAGGELNVIVDGINVGAQPYWNAESTMLMHTRGILVMTPRAAMVLTGKRALDYSGSVSAEDNMGIGGYDRIMGVNGQAQYWAHDLEHACQILFQHYDHTYIARGERFPRQSASTDPISRDVRAYTHGEIGESRFDSVGEIFTDQTNPGRKKSFDIRRVMMATVDRDSVPLERWAGMRSAETSVVWDAHLGGYPICLIGIESRPVPRLGFVPADGPEQWCAGTLFPQSSKKVARAINSASNNRPVVILANLSGFDGSPESMRKLQLEYGAEIGRAVVNFKGPIVFCVISRYHGGAYVVFSKALNEGLEVAALEGAYASVIGGAPAAAVVFSSEVETRTRNDPRVRAIAEALSQAEGAEKSTERARLEEVSRVVRSEKLGELADEFDRVHSVQRALQVGALDAIIPPAALRPYLIGAIERGMQKFDAPGGLEQAGLSRAGITEALAVAVATGGANGCLLAAAEPARSSRK